MATLWSASRIAQRKDDFASATIILEFYKAAAASDQWLSCIGARVLPTLYDAYQEVISSFRDVPATKGNKSKRFSLTIPSKLQSNVPALLFLSSILDVSVECCDVDESYSGTHLENFILATSAVLLASTFDVTDSQETKHQGTNSRALSEEHWACDVLRRNASLSLANIAESVPSCLDGVTKKLQSRQPKLMCAIRDAPELSIQRSLLRFAKLFYDHASADGPNSKFVLEMDLFLSQLEDGISPKKANIGHDSFSSIDLVSEDKDASKQVETFRRLLCEVVWEDTSSAVRCTAMNSCHVYVGQSGAKEKSIAMSVAKIDWNLRGLSIKVRNLVSEEPLHIAYSQMAGVQVSAESRELEFQVKGGHVSCVSISFSCAASRLIFEESILPYLKNEAGKVVKVVPESGKTGEALDGVLTTPGMNRRKVSKPVSEARPSHKSDDGISAFTDSELNLVPRCTRQNVVESAFTGLQPDGILLLPRLDASNDSERDVEVSTEKDHEACEQEVESKGASKRLKTQRTHSKTVAALRSTLTVKDRQTGGSNHLLQNALSPKLPREEMQKTSKKQVPAGPLRKHLPEQSQNTSLHSTDPKRLMNLNSNAALPTRPEQAQTNGISASEGDFDYNSNWGGLLCGNTQQSVSTADTDDVGEALQVPEEAKASVANNEVANKSRSKVTSSKRGASKLHLPARRRPDSPPASETPFDGLDVTGQEYDAHPKDVLMTEGEDSSDSTESSGTIDNDDGSAMQLSGESQLMDMDPDVDSSHPCESNPHGDRTAADSASEDTPAKSESIAGGTKDLRDRFGARILHSSGEQPNNFSATSEDESEFDADTSYESEPSSEAQFVRKLAMVLHATLEKHKAESAKLQKVARAAIQGNNKEYKMAEELGCTNMKMKISAAAAVHKDKLMKLRKRLRTATKQSSNKVLSISQSVRKLKSNFAAASTRQDERLLGAGREFASVQNELCAKLSADSRAAANRKKKLTSKSVKSDALLAGLSNLLGDSV